MKVAIEFFILCCVCFCCINCTIITLSNNDGDDLTKYVYQQSPAGSAFNKLNFTTNSNSNSNYKVPETQNLFNIINEWKFLDFEYNSYTERQRAIAERFFVPENNLPLGIDIFADRIFITTPRWKDGVPASLSTLSYPPKELSPPLRPYPNWQSHGDPYNPDCTKIISVYRTSIDKCGRLWAIDSGIVNATVSLNQICPPKILAFDLVTDQWILSYEIPPDQVKQDSLHSNILANIPHNDCQDAFVYVTDVWRFGIFVYSLKKNRGWRVTNYNFLPSPPSSDFNIYGLNFQWFDGVFGMSLLNPNGNHDHDRILYFHPMASNKEFAVSTSILADETLWPNNAQNVSKYFVEIGDRGPQGQSSTSGVAANGVMFFTQVHQDNVGCWDTRKPYTRNNLRLLIADQDQENLIVFPNDLKIDKEIVDQGLWIMSNRLPIYLYGQLDFGDINFRILRASIHRAISGTICDPNIAANFNIRNAKVSEGQCF